MDINTRVDRREFLRSAAISSAVLVGGAPMLGIAAERKGTKGKGVEEVSPVEELMREHGALRRIFLIYEEAIRRIAAKQELDPALLHQSAGIVERYIHQLHEKLEEDYLFPRLKTAGRNMDTVYVLVAQHRAGEKLTQTVLKLSNAAHFRNQSDLAAVSSALTQFIRMYRPHAAWEDTTTFPEFKKVLSVEEYDRVGDQFKAKEQEVLGREGFEGVVGRIERVEDELGISTLSQFSPQG